MFWKIPKYSVQIVCWHFISTCSASYEIPNHLQDTHVIQVKMTLDKFQFTFKNAAKNEQTWSDARQKKYQIDSYSTDMPCHTYNICTLQTFCLFFCCYVYIGGAHMCIVFVDSIPHSIFIHCEAKTTICVCVILN